MRGFSFSSLRFRLVFLVLLAIVPALGLILYTAAEQRRSAAGDVLNNALRLARLAAGDQEQLVEGTRQLLIALAQLPQIHQRDSRECSALFANLLKQYPLYANLGAIELDGALFCSARPYSSPINLADRTYFRRAVESRGFAVGRYQIGRATGKATINFGYPVLDGSGIPRAVIFAAVDLTWLNRLASTAQLPEGSVFTITDHNGAILARYPDADNWIGKSLLEVPIIRVILSRKGEGTARASGIDGVPRLYAFIPLRSASGIEAMYLSIGIPQKVAFADADWILKRNLLGLGMVAALALIAAWFGADLFILRRVNTLVNATNRLSAGDLSVRSGAPYVAGELGQLARSFDQMAGSMERLVTERKLIEHRLASLYGINVAITSTLDLHAVLTILMEKIELFIPYTAVLVWLRNSESGQLERAACWNLDEKDWKSRKLKSIPSLVQIAIDTKMPVVAANVQTDPRTLDPEFYRRNGLISYLGVPLPVEDKVLGVLVFLTREEHQFSEDEIQFLSTVANQAAIAIHKSQLYEEVRQRTRALSALYTIASVANETLNLSSVLQAVIKQITGIFHFDASRIFLLDSQTGELHLRDSFEARPGVFGIREAVRVGVGINGRVAENGEPLIFEDVQLNPLYREISQTKATQTGEFSFFAVFPIKAGRKILGTIVCIGANPRRLTTDEIQLISSMADRMGVVIENATLFERIKNQAWELERANNDLKRREEIQKLIKELSQDITSLDIESLLRKLTEKVREVFDIDISDVRIKENEIWQVKGVSGLEPRRMQSDSTGTARGRSKWIIDNRRPLIVSDIEEAKNILTGSVLSGLGIRGYAGVPLFSRSGEVVGVLRALSYRPRDFTPEEVDLLQQLANGAAIALENARLMEEINNSKAKLENANRTLTLQAVELTRSNEKVQARYGELLILKTLSETILRSSDLRSVTENILEQAMVSGSFDLGNVRLLDSSGDILEVVASRGYRDPQNILRHRPLSRTQQAAQSRFGDRIYKESCVEEYVQTAPGLRTLKKEGVESFIEVPIRAEAQILGIIQLASRTLRKFKPEEINLLETIGNQIGATVQKAQLYEETQRQALELEKASKMQADFTAMIIHDLRSPVMNIMGTAEVMAEGVFGPVNEEQKKWLRKLLASGHGLVNLISDYLDISKVEAGRIDITKEDMDLGQLIQNSIENYLPLVRERNTSITSAVRPGVFRINADCRRLNQVLGNLLSNAVKFTCDGGQIEVGVDRANSTDVKVWVKDNGEGIGHEEIGSLFEKYRQLKSGKISEHKGTGLGLVICKTIIEAHGGRIWVESEENKGTTFFFTLPVTA